MEFSIGDEVQIPRDDGFQIVKILDAKNSQEYIVYWHCGKFIKSALFSFFDFPKIYVQSPL